MGWSLSLVPVLIVAIAEQCRCGVSYSRLDVGSSVAPNSERTESMGTLYGGRGEEGGGYGGRGGREEEGGRGRGEEGGGGRGREEGREGRREGGRREGGRREGRGREGGEKGGREGGERGWGGREERREGGREERGEGEGGEKGGGREGREGREERGEGELKQSHHHAAVTQQQSSDQMSVCVCMCEHGRANYDNTAFMPNRKSLNMKCTRNDCSCRQTFTEQTLIGLAICIHEHATQTRSVNKRDRRATSHINVSLLIITLALCCTRAFKYGHDSHKERAEHTLSVPCKAALLLFQALSTGCILVPCFQLSCTLCSYDML